jgi:hypothetical protein
MSELPDMSERPDIPEQTPGGLEQGMKPMPVMVYTDERLIWGDIHINENLRVNLILLSTDAPDYISLYNAKQILLATSVKSEPAAFAEIHIPTDIIIGFHLMPSHSEPVDYDEAEPNRKMEPIVAQIGKFNFNGYARMSTQTNIKNFIQVTRAAFISLYDLEIVQSANPNQQPMKVAIAQVRRNIAVFSNRQ